MSPSSGNGGGDGAAELEALARLSGVEKVERVADSAPGTVRVRVYVTGEAPMMVAPVATTLAELGISLNDVRLGEPSLEDVFISLTGRALR